MLVWDIGVEGDEEKDFVLVEEGFFGVGGGIWFVIEDFGGVDSECDGRHMWLAAGVGHGDLQVYFARQEDDSSKEERAQGVLGCNI